MLNQIEKYFLSIIIPVYNVEKHIDNCLMSILCQKVHDCEIILVDDGSSDNSGFICDKYVSQYSFIRVIHKNNLGLSSARNEGLKVASGKYLWFIDSDDVINENAISIILNFCSKESVDILCFPYYTVVNDKFMLSGSKNKPIDSVVITNLEYVEKYEITISACFQIIKHSVISDNHLFFLEGLLHEDHDFVFRLFSLAHSISYINTPLYHYYIRSNNSITSKCDVDSYLKRLDSLIIIMSNLEFYFPCSTEKNKYSYYMKYYKANNKNFVLRLLLLSPLSYDIKKMYIEKLRQIGCFKFEITKFLTFKNRVFNFFASSKRLYMILLFLTSKRNA